jgi:hypothetical protein
MLLVPTPKNSGSKVSDAVAEAKRMLALRLREACICNTKGVKTFAFFCLLPGSRTTGFQYSRGDAAGSRSTCRSQTVFLRLTLELIKYRS